MPIKGLTDRASLNPRLPRLGKLRKGGEKTANKPGPDLDHFRFTSDRPEIMEAWAQAYGEQPRLVNAVLFYDTVEENFETWIEAWDASGLVFRSDGENYVLWRDGDKYRRTPKPHQDVDDQNEIGRLTILVPELIQQGFVGTVTMETHSNHDLRNITAALMAAEEQGNGLRGTRFVIRRVEEEISTPGFGARAGKRSKTKKWLVKLELPRQLWTMLDAPDDLPQLEDGIDTETGEIIEEHHAEPMPRPQEPEHKPGAGPTQNNRTKNTEPRPANTEQKAVTQAMHIRWDELHAQASALDILVPAVGWEITYDDFVARAKDLKEAIAQREADLAAAKE